MAHPNSRLLIDGNWKDAADRKTLPVLNPATGSEIAQVACAGTVDLDLALEAAQRGFDAWRATPAFERASKMRRVAEILRTRSRDIARLITLEQGKPLKEALMETQGTPDIIEWFADEGLRVYGRIVPSRSPLTRQMVLKEPVGPVVAFTPWNFPVNEAVRKICAALASGCSIIVKAPEETPAAPAAMMQAFLEADIPSGVVGLVFGVPADVSSYLIASPIVRKVSFTGSTAVGKQLAALAGLHMKRVTMELGGHAPVIIAEDADLDLAIKNLCVAKYKNAGQVCTAPTRFLVHRSVATDFTMAFGKFADSMRVGDGMLEETQMGPLANARRVVAMKSLTEDAMHRGAKLIAGDTSPGSVGNFWKPTVLGDVPRTASVFNEEPFGPIAAIQPFDYLDDAINEANRLPYGLAAYAYTRHLRVAHELSGRIEAGSLWINQSASPYAELPHCGLKDSGYGSQNGPEALEGHLNTRVVSVMNV